MDRVVRWINKGTGINGIGMTTAAVGGHCDTVGGNVINAMSTRIGCMARLTICIAGGTRKCIRYKRQVS